MTTRRTKPAIPPAFRVEGWNVDPAEGTLSKEDVSRRLEPKVMAVLVYLFENRARVVTKDELLAAVWPDAHVEEIALARSVSEIRRVLGDDPKKPRIIKTFPKRGYKWVAASPQAERRDVTPVVLGAVAVIGVALAAGLFLRSPRESFSPRTVAVLPFVNLNEDAETDYFADGITEDVITQLSKIDGLRVVSRTSVTLYRGSQKSLTAIARELRVAAILEGSVRREGDRVRIVGQLVDAESDTHLWAATYDRDIEDVFEVQRDVAKSIAGALEARLTASDKRRLERAPTSDALAYDAYLRGRSFYQRRDRAGLESAKALFERAVALDADFSLAYAGLADTYSSKARNARDYVLARDGLAAAGKALALDPDLPEGHKALGFAYAAHDLYGEAIGSYERALELRPGYWQAANNLAVAYGVIGQLELAYEWRRRTLALDPARAIPRANFGEALRALGFDDEAAMWLRFALEIEPYNYGAQTSLGLIEMHDGRFKAARTRIEGLLDVNPSCGDCFLRLALLATLDADNESARTHLERALTLPGDPTVVRLRLAAVRAKAGERLKAEELLELAESRPRAAIADGSEWWGPRWSLAAAASVRGDLDAAVAAYQEAHRLGRRDYRWDSLDPLFENVRRDPRFVAVLDTMKRDVLIMRRRVATVPLPPPSSRASAHPP